MTFGALRVPHFRQDRFFRLNPGSGSSSNARTPGHFPDRPDHPVDPDLMRRDLIYTQGLQVQHGPLHPPRRLAQAARWLADQLMVGTPGRDWRGSAWPNIF